MGLTSNTWAPMLPMMERRAAYGNVIPINLNRPIRPGEQGFCGTYDPPPSYLVDYPSDPLCKATVLWFGPRSTRDGSCSIAPAKP